METNELKDKRFASASGRISVGAGVGAIIAMLSADLFVSFVDAIEMNAGHPVSDLPSFLAPTLSYVLSLVAISFGIASFRSTSGSHSFAVAGVSIGVTILALAIFQIPADLVYQVVRHDSLPL
ncbi:hypothetical protein Bequi_13385 [Brachybacterium sp. JHP9]|uniref:Uncharacterized protein n=1 Tax=Brachybacterium equifaecis TaxID=2910770 RepID=A0ABT0R347_9MICO|nr:hypothetical protein [Brachybacterium equifaecis]MCL6424357.1 hypothetical protein [Brachybacterium equifaecis]